MFVEFSNMSSVKRFLEADPKPTWEGKELLIMSKYVKVASDERKNCFSDQPHREAYCEMKIKEKGLSGKAADFRRQMYKNNGRGFDAFREMQKGDKSKENKPKPKPEVFLEFMGKKIKVQEEDSGSVKDEDIPYVKHSALKFTGCGGELQWDEIKVRVIWLLLVWVMLTT